MDVLSLNQILEVFNAPINEEQAWALCYQCAKWLQDDWEHRGNDGCFRLESLTSVFVHKDGGVSCGTQNSEKVYTQAELVQSLGVLVFQALDYGLGEGEEHKLSPQLETLIEHMTDSTDNGGEEKDVSVDGDEGIENDSEEDDLVDKSDHNHITLQDVIQRCEGHLIVASEAVSHYRAVCRALVAEAQELLSFLDKVTIEQKILKESPDEVDCCEIDLCRADWARLWIQLMKELRHGVKLKKVEHGCEPPIEYALTPYEILMQDIKSRRYTLNKVMVNGSFPPRVKADAHSMILEFIRSRPPLHPVKDRVLNSPPPKDHSPHEQLLQAIRSEPRLRPVSPAMVETSRTKLDEGDATPNTMRRLIKPDISLIKFSISDDEDSDLEDEEDDEDSEDEKNKVTPSPLSPLTPLSPHSPWQNSVDVDVNGQAVAFRHDRRHSITVCQSPTKAEARLPGDIKLQLPTTTNSASGRTNNHPLPPLPFTLIGQSGKPIGNPMECLSLTVEEVMHIRGVLTKAELECQMNDTEMRELLERGKVCFTCKTTRFSLFGPWSTKCRFCKRNVCSKCFSKMQIPTEHFEHIPVYTLSPSPLSPKTSKDVFSLFENTGSAPSSPVQERRCSDTRESSTDANGNSDRSNKRSRPPMQRSMTVARPPAPPPSIIQGPMMAVCKDCKLMICHIIRASRVSLGKHGYGEESEYSLQKPSRKLHLDLKPVYK